MVKDDRYRAMTFAGPKYIPVGISVLAGGWAKYRDDLAALVREHPIVFGEDPKIPDFDTVAADEGCAAGEYEDAWGCRWRNVYEGHGAMVVGHPVPRREYIHGLKAPDKDAGVGHGFMYLRLADLRGFEELMIDFAEEPPELQMLIDIVLEYALRQVDKLLAVWRTWGNDDDLIGLGDDLGMQHSLPISPEKWRKYLKPCFAKLFGRCKEVGHPVMFHSDGHIFEIIPDLVECGVEIINPQYRANGLDNLVRACKGKVCVNLDLDRQLFPFCAEQELDAHVRGAVEALGSREGGLWLSAEVDDGVPLATIEAMCHILEKYRGFYAW